MPALSARNISKSYTGHTALADLSADIPEQSIVGLLGPNGAGKTTLIRIINQIIIPDQGSVLVFGEPLSPHHTGVIGYLPEERGLYKKMKVGEQLLFLARLRGLSHAAAMHELKYWFKRFGIEDWWGKKVEDLSKGMAQKVQFIGTVVHRPKLIILDEPFSGFDPVNAKLITEVILGLRQEGATIIFSTHRMETVESLCDHVIMINKSRKVLEGTREEVRNRFRTKTWRLEFKGQLELSPEIFDIRRITDTAGESPIHTAEVRFREGGATATNELLRAAMASAEIISFREELPSMTDIFISLVDGDKDESLRNHLEEPFKPE